MSTLEPPAPGAQPREGALGPYLRAVRSHKLLVVLVTLATVIAAIAWLQVRSPEYEASAQLLVTPLPADDETFLGLSVLRESGDPTRVVQTAATLVESPRAAALAARRLGGDWTQKDVLGAIKVDPQGQSNILEVIGTSDKADEAARLTNTFTRASLNERNRVLRSQVRDTLSELRARQRTLRDPTGAAQAELAGRIDRLSNVLTKGDPSVELSQRATVPTSPTGAGSTTVIGLALLAGLVLATGAALLMELFDRRIRDEEELTTLYPLPVLVRVPSLPRRQRRQQTEIGWFMPPVVREAFRTILAQLDSLGNARTIMVTSASSGDGKSTSSVNLAVSIAASGHSVVLMDLDLRKPDIGNLLRIETNRALPELLSEKTTKRGLGHLLAPAPNIPGLKVLTTGGAHGDAAVLDVLNRRLPSLLEQARSEAEYVVIDTPPLGEVSDALRAAQIVDAVVLVARPGNTNRRTFEITVDLLHRTGRTPAGYLIMGAEQGSTGMYYGYGDVAASKDDGATSRLPLPRAVKGANKAKAGETAAERG